MGDATLAAIVRARAAAQHAAARLVQAEAATLEGHDVSAQMLGTIEQDLEQALERVRRLRVLP